MSIPAYDAVGSATGAKSYTHVCGAGASLLLVGTCNENGGAYYATAVTYAGVPMTQLGDNQATVFQWWNCGSGWVYTTMYGNFWYLMSPTVGSNTVDVTSTAAAGNVSCTGLSFTLAAQPTLNYTIEKHNSNQTLTASLTGVREVDILAGIVFMPKLFTGSNTAITGQTVRSNVNSAAGAHAPPIYASGTEALASTTGSEGIGWSWTGTYSGILLGVAIPPPSAGGNMWWT